MIDYGKELQMAYDDGYKQGRYDEMVETEMSLPKWIPCSERLPENDAEVFIYLFDWQTPYIAWVTDNCWFTEDFQVEKEDYPKAWMPLPKPFKGGDGND